MRKLALIVSAVALITGLLIPQGATAAVTVQRTTYDLGQACARLPSGNQCWFVPPGRNFSNTWRPQGDNFYYEVARQAYTGHLLLANNRWADPFLPGSVSGGDQYGEPWRSVYRSSTTVFVPGPQSGSSMDTTVDIDGLNPPVPPSSSFYFCLQIMEWNSIIAQDCLGYDTPARDLQATAPVRSDAEYRIVVILFDFYGNHSARVKVNRITYTIQ